MSNPIIVVGWKQMCKIDFQLWISNTFRGSEIMNSINGVMKGFFSENCICLNLRPILISIPSIL